MLDVQRGIAASGVGFGLDLGVWSNVYGCCVSTTRAPAGGLRVSELAATVDVNPNTVRYYERAGLLPPPARTPAGYRVYDAGRRRRGQTCGPAR
ncbi:MerR family DNA-binding transcriptional regulator [Dactylosporangium sp. NPDC048998]|uniref:MerR family DNA-binding transcriptional regulator n=1 Tax=Dactylosporangium sp. NPDC048998 TaxID=3363976 RepID=UPI00371858DA